MDPHNFTNRIQNIFRSFVHSSASDNHNDNSNPDDDMPALEPISPNDVAMNTEAEQDNEMPPLQYVSDSSEDENEVEMQAVGSGSGPIDLAQSPTPRMNRRARVEDDDDDDRDRRHPSQRVGSSTNAPSPSPSSSSNASPARPSQQQPYPQQPQRSALPPFFPGSRVRTGGSNFPGILHTPTDVFRIYHSGNIPPSNPAQGINVDGNSGFTLPPDLAHVVTPPVPHPPNMQQMATLADPTLRAQQHATAAGAVNRDTTGASLQPGTNNNNANVNNNPTSNDTATAPHPPADQPLFSGDFTITLDFTSGTPIVRHMPVGATGPVSGAGGTTNPPIAPSGTNTAPMGATAGEGTAPAPAPAPARLAVPGVFLEFLQMLDGFGPEREVEDPERAKKLVDALEEVPVGLVRRLEVLSGEGRKGDEKQGEGGNEEGGLVAGDCGCAICWDRLLSEEGAGFGAEKEESTPDATESTSTEETLSNEPSSTAITTDYPEPSPPSSPTTQPTKSKYPKIVSLPCAHLFHAECLIPWFSRPRQTTCPTCRFDLDPEELIGTKRRNGGGVPVGIPMPLPNGFEFAPPPAQMAANSAGGAGAGPGPGWTDGHRVQTGIPQWAGLRHVNDNGSTAQGAVNAAMAAAEGNQAAPAVPTPDAASAPTAAPAGTGPTPNAGPGPQSGFLTIGFDVFIRGVPAEMGGEMNQLLQPQPQADTPNANAGGVGAGNNDPAAAPVNGPSIQGMQRMNLGEMMGGMGVLNFGGLLDAAAGAGAGGGVDFGNNNAAGGDENNGLPLGAGEGEVEIDGWPGEDDDDGEEFIDFLLPIGVGGPANPTTTAQANDVSSNAAAPSTNTSTNHPDSAEGSQRQQPQHSRPAQVPQMPPMAIPMPLPPWLNPAVAGAGAGGGGPGAIPGVHWAAGTGRTVDEALASLFGRLPRQGQEGDNNGGASGQPQPQPQPQASEGGGAAQEHVQAQGPNPIPQANGQNTPAGRGQIQDFLAGLVRAYMQQQQQPQGQAQAPTQGPTPATAGTPTMGGNLPANANVAGGNAPPPRAFAPMHFVNFGPAGPMPAAAAGGAAGTGFPPLSFFSNQAPRTRQTARRSRPFSSPPENPSRPLSEKKPWMLPPPPGPTLRERIERREREAGLRCFDMSCGVGPSDEEPITSLTEAARRQLNIHTLPLGDDGDDDVPMSEGAKRNVCGHTFHPSCLVSSARVALMGGDVPVVDGGDVEVACSVCRGVGSVAKGDWDEGVRALE